MDLRKSWRVWLVAGCGCVVAGAVVVGALGLLFSLWPKPFGPHTPPKSGAVDSYEKERSRTLESVLGEANAAVGRRGRNLHRGQLDHTRDVTLRCGDGLTVAIRAGTFDAPLPVRVDAMEVARDHVAPGDTVLAAFDVKVGAGGPLRQPVHLTVSHAAVRDDDDVLAGRWDEQKAQWVALPVVRRSPTSSEVTTDHLSTLVVTSSPLWMSDRYQVLGSRFTLYLEKGVVPDPELLYKWPADEVLSSGPALLARRQRFQKAADQYGFTDTTLASKRRYTDTVSRVVFAAVMEGLLTSIANEYERRGFGPPPSVRVFIGTYDSPQWVTLSIGHRINIPANQGLESPELLAVNLAHELFHACQGQSGLSLARMLHDKWVVEAMAEYASTRVAWGSGRSNAFGEAGVVLDGGTVQAQMGDGITPRFIEAPLLSTAGDGPYLGAHFVEYLVSRAPGAGFEGLYRKLVAGAGGLTGGSSEDIVAGFAADNGLVLSEVYADFVAHLVLDPKSPARAGASPTATPGAATAPLSLEPPVLLDASKRSWDERLFTHAAYTGDYTSVGIEPSAAAGQGSRVIALTVSSAKPGAEVRVFKARGAVVDLRTEVALAKETGMTSPITVASSVASGESLFVVAARGGGESPEISVHAELSALELVARRIDLGHFRFQVQGAPDGDVVFEWVFQGEGDVSTREPFVEKTFGAAGEHEVRVTVRTRRGGTGDLGTASVRVNVTLPLVIAVVDAETGRPVGSARLRFDLAGRTVERSVDQRGRLRIEEPPAGVLRVVASAPGYETSAAMVRSGQSPDEGDERRIALVPVRTIRRPEPPRSEPPRPEPPRPEPPPPTVRPAPPRPTPTAEVDDRAALEAWIAAFERRWKPSGREDTYSWTARFEWVIRPTIVNGEILGAFNVYTAKQYDNGQVVPPYISNSSGGPGAPVRLGFVAELRPYQR